LIPKTRQATAIELDRGPWRWRDRVYWVVPGLLIVLGIGLRAGASAPTASIRMKNLGAKRRPRWIGRALIDMVAHDISHPRCSMRW